MLMFTPRRVSSSIAGSPAAVPGTLIITFGWASRCHKLVAWAMVASRVVGQIGGALEGDEPVAAPAVLICRAQQAGGRADVVEREREEQLLRVTLPARDQRAQLVVVAVGVGDRLGEDGGIGRRAGDAVVVDQLGEPAGLEQLAGQRVQPDRYASLPEPLQIGIGCHGHSSAQPFSRRLAGQHAKRGGRDRPAQPPRRPGASGPAPGRARFTVSPARLAGRGRGSHLAATSAHRRYAGDRRSPTSGLT